MKLLFSILSLTLLLPAYGSPPEPPDGMQWIINPDFTDEFDGRELDAEKWNDHHPRWKGRPPARFMPENVSVKDGHLRLTNGMLDKPIKEHYGEFTIGGAAVISRKTTAHYGYYECRLKASSISMSSTFWMSNSGHHYPGIGRVSQELDILETVGGSKKNQNYAWNMNSNTHVWHGGTSDGRTAGNRARLPVRADEDFNVYGCWWENANTAHFYLNNQHVGTVDFDTSLIPHPFEHPMHINMVTETYDWETPPTPDEVNDKKINTTLIDWVRAYTLEPSDGSLPEWKLKQFFEQLRNWSYDDGKRTVEAKIVKVSSFNVQLEKRNGKKVRMKIRDFVEKDRDLLLQIKQSL